MKNYGVRINYLFNSGFAVETEKHLLIFDYYMDSVEGGTKNRANGAIGEEDLKADKKIIVFSSHSHGDHFNPVVLNWASIRPDIRYILSSDIDLKEKNDRISIMSAYEELNLEDIYIKAYGSTDLGVSFLVKVEGINLFHAGDLNWWYWWDDTEEEIKKAESWFKEEIERMKGEAIEIAFFPVDPRLEHNYCAGGEYFINAMKPEIFIPMHFGENYAITEQFANKMNGSGTRLIEMKNRGQEIRL
jgi:L-ascorbate metabolism protein UlaG (beta-lactamase superfamily)